VYYYLIPRNKEYKEAQRTSKKTIEMRINAH
jgi:hypothetical protein